MKKITKNYTLKDIQELESICEEFKNHNPNHKLYYSFIGPKENKELKKFSMLIKDSPSISASYFEVLSNSKYIKELLQMNFNTDTKLDVYIAVNDLNSGFFTDLSLNQFIDRFNLKS